LIKIEDLLDLQLELYILKIVLAEERTAHIEAEDRSASLGDKLHTANLCSLQACGQSEAMEKELNCAKSVIEALESQQIILINESEELKKNDEQNKELLNKRGIEISRLNNELDIHHQKEYLFIEDSKMQLLKCSNNEDSPLQRKLKRMQASLEKARDLNTRYQRDQASHISAEQEMDEIRRQVEAETTEVIMCLQDELSLLQQKLEASKKNELLTNHKLHEVLKENEMFSFVIMEKEKEIELLTNDWDRLAADIESYLVDGNAALVEASDQVAFISKSFARRKWVEDQVEKICQGISERDELLGELQNRLKEADDIRCDLDLKLKSLRGAMQAVNEVHQQEKSDQEKEIYLLRSQLSEQGYVNNQQVEQIHRIELLLDESIETFVQQEVLEQNDISLQRGMEEEIHQLQSQLDQSKRCLAHLLSQTQDKDLAIEKLKNEEFTVLLRLMSDVLKAKGIIHELEVGFNELQSSITVNPEETVSQNSDLNFGDRVS
jgi:kinesin family member 15